MDSKGSMIFSIRRAFVHALVVLLGSVFALAVVCVIQGEEAFKIALLGFILLVLTGMLAVSLFRRLEVFPDRVVLHRFGQIKTMNFVDVTDVESLAMRNRVFLTLCAGEEFLILSNAYGRFPELVDVLLSRAPGGSFSDRALAMAAAPPVRRGDIVSCWLATGLVLVILWHQLYGGG
jgi:hypothetical protein